MRPAPPPPTPRADFVRLLADRLPTYGVTISPERLERFAAYLALVEAANARIRLVGDASPAVLVTRHLGESLALGTYFPLDRQKLVDLGSGAGFPGLALALAHEGVAATLVESNHKKANFHSETCKNLDIAGRVQVQAEFLERRPNPKSPLIAPLRAAELITVRALDRMEEVPRWLPRWLRPHTPCAFWVTAERAAAWRREYPEWSWQEFHLLPGTEQRGILLGVSRGTMGEG